MFLLDTWLAISLVSDPTWRHLLSLFGSFAIGVASGIYNFWDALQVSQKQKLRESDLNTGLANGVIEEKFFKILDGTVFKEPEHHMRIWALQIEHGRHFVWYDYDSYQRRDSRGWVKPCTDLQILSLPNTDFEISEFSGEQIQARRAKTLTIEPRDWPADGTFLDATKDALFEIFCPRK